jgi:hypothetical protein
MKVGDRVGAILGGKGDTVKFFGYGVYEGDFVPKEAVGFMAEIAAESEHPNPRIRLDDGKAVYGCECWWGPEEAIKEQIAKYPNVIQVDIDEVRANYKEEAAKQAAANVSPD